MRRVPSGWVGALYFFGRLLSFGVREPEPLTLLLLVETELDVLRRNFDPRSRDLIEIIGSATQMSAVSKSGTRFLSVGHRSFEGKI